MQKIKTDFLEQLPRSYFQQLSLLLRRLLVAYLAYFVCRILFFAYNHAAFVGVGLVAFLWDCLAGLRFDTFSIMVSNSLFILLSALPFGFFWKSWYQRTLKWLFIILNAVFLLFNLIDVAYYPFIKKRSTSEIFDQLGGQSELSKLLPQFLADFWWLVLFFIFFIYALILSYHRVRIKQLKVEKKNRRVLNWSLFVLIIGMATLGIRGGLQRVPIDVVNAGSMTTVEEVPLVLNSPFTIIKSMNQKALQELHYYDEQTLKTIYHPIHQYEGAQMRKDNVVVIILESFSKEYTKLGKTISLTPFLDSLMDHSLVFTNAFSNGTKSIEGIPAILSSLPSLMPNPFINSIYANNEQSSLARLLGAEGYHTAFFHGGINGTMNFDDWAKLAGYQEYYGKNEYGDDKDFDGFWGIWDEPFLQYATKKISRMKEPFHAAIFTLSSHHPYQIPKKYTGQFKTTKLENSESIGYADHSLALFFNTAKKEKWYNNTLFVLVADHTGISEHPFYSRVVGLTSIPILFFKPDNSLQGKHGEAFSQIDILPSILHYLGYNKPFFAFGDAYTEKQRGNDFMNAGAVIYQMGDSSVYGYADHIAREAYLYKRDSSMQNQILGQYPQLDSLSLKQYRSFMQTYNDALIHNKAIWKK